MQSVSLVAVFAHISQLTVDCYVLPGTLGFVHSEQRARSFPGGSEVKKFSCNAGDTGDAGWIPG